MSSKVLLIVGVSVVTALVLYYYFNTTKTDKFVDKMIDKTVLNDTIYFKLTDDVGNTSTIHDSGIKPSSLKGKNNILMKVVKYEYNDGIEKILSKPVEIAIGQNIFNLTKVIKLKECDIQEKKDHYVIKIDNLWR